MTTAWRVTRLTRVTSVTIHSLSVHSLPCFWSLLSLAGLMVKFISRHGSSGDGIWLCFVFQSHSHKRRNNIPLSNKRPFQTKVSLFFVSFSLSVLRSTHCVWANDACLVSLGR